MLYILVVIFSFLFTLYAVFRSEGMQSLLIHLGAHYLSKELKTEVTIRGIDFSVLHGLVIEDILVRDRYHDILFSAAALSVKPGKISLKNHQVNLSQVFVDKGIFQLITQKGDSTLNLQFILDYFASADTTKKKDTLPSKPWDLSISNVSLRSTRFHFQDKNKPLVPLGMDYSNIDVSAIDLDLTDIAFAGDTIYANIKQLSARERSGFVLHNLSGEFQVSPAFLKAHNLKILTDHSDLALTFDFLYDHWGAYNDFLNEVTIQTKIEPSYLDLQDIGYFAPELLVMKDRIRLSGDIKGTVANFKARNLRFAFGNNTFFWGNVSALGLPDVEETFIDLNIKAMNTTKTDIESFLIPGDIRNLELPGILSNIGVVNVKGNFTGFYNDFVASVHLNTNLGNITTDLTLKRQKGSRLLGYKGQLDAGTFDLGKLIGKQGILGTVTMRTDINGQGLNLKDANLVMNVHIDSIFLNKYNYRNLDLTGSLADQKFNGKLAVRDPNLNLDFEGLIDLGDTLPNFDFSAMIHKAQLFRLHLLDRDSSLNLLTRIKVDFTGNSLDNIDGTINIDSLVYREGNQVISMDHFSLNTKQDTATGKSYHLRSDFVDADVTGSFSFKALIPSLTTFIKNYLASFSLRDSLIEKENLTNQVMNYHILFKQSGELTAVFLPILEVAPNSSLYGSYNEEKGSLIMMGKSPALIVSGIELNDWFLDAENKRNNLLIQTGCSGLFLKKSDNKDSLEVKLDSVHLVSVVRHDSILNQLSWSDRAVKSEVNGFLSFIKSPAVEIQLTHFNVFMNQKFWSVDSKNRMTIDTSGSVHLSNLGFFSEDQYFTLNGNYSSKAGDTLEVNFNKVDISQIDKLLNNDQIDFDGILSGQVKLTNPGKHISVCSDLHIKKLVFNHEALGDANLNITYDDLASRFDVLSEIIYHGNVGTNIPFSLKGSYFLAKPNPHFDFDLTLKNLNLRMVGPFVKSFMTGLNGLASGHVKITGTPEKPNLAGQLRLARTEFKINYLNVPYSFADVVNIDSTAFHFDNITIFDSLGHKSILNGQISHHNFGDFRVGLNVKMTDFSAFNNTRAQNSIFFGKARGSGNVNITGPFDNISVEVKANTAGNTHVVIPIDLTQSVGQSDYIIFLKPDSDSSGIHAIQKQPTGNGLTLNLGLRVNQDAQVEVFLPNQLGSLKANGTGNLFMGMTPTTPFMLSGTYTLSKGSFLFTFKNVLRKPMQINEGSIISWTGDPADANISVTATYKTRAPLKGLTTSVEEEGIRVPVECIIRLSGKLLNPEISFGINLPNAPENIRNIVYSCIDTTNATIMSEQTIYLMMLNQFKPVVGASGTVDVGSAGMSLITNQLSSWLSGINQHVNVDVNYKMATATTSQEFDVGISTQLFNDRLLIDGTFGMNSYNNATIQQSSTIVGDINIQYVLTANRRWRVHTFNRTNTLNILNNNAPYTQGVGLTYQRDFSNFGDLFKPSKKKIK
ncbi:MAG: translocation/assembly module TamB domain-containing protein [Bacteroidales bacterium]|nr:translocation/assembly module TamB domain-containing protein [Bacteroidales bacterium]